MNSPHLIKKTTDPTSAPPEAGIHWVNISNGSEWFSVGSSSVADWVLRQAAASASIQVEYFTLGASEVTAKEIELAGVPASANKTLVSVDGAANCFYNLDYTVTGKKVKWNGTRLDGLLETGDRIQVVYFS